MTGTGDHHVISPETASMICDSCALMYNKNGAHRLERPKKSIEGLSVKLFQTPRAHGLVVLLASLAAASTMTAAMSHRSSAAGASGGSTPPPNILVIVLDGAFAIFFASIDW